MKIFFFLQNFQNTNFKGEARAKNESHNEKFDRGVISSYKNLLHSFMAIVIKYMGSSLFYL